MFRLATQATKSISNTLKCRYFSIDTVEKTSKDIGKCQSVADKIVSFK